MKKVAVFIALSVLFLNFKGVANADDDRWYYQGVNKSGDKNFYDQKTIKRVSASIIRVWTKIIYSSPKPDGEIESAVFLEIDCTERTARPIQGQGKYKTGETKYSTEPGPLFHIPPKSTLEDMFESVCRK